MKKCKIYKSLLPAVFLAVNIMPGQAMAVEASHGQVQVEAGVKAAGQPVLQQKKTGIVFLGSSRYLQPAYMDILSRYLVKCYSRYRYPTEYGESMQKKCQEAMAKKNFSMLHNITEKQLAELVNDMDKDQVLFIHISDVVRRKQRIFLRPSAEDLWEADIAMKAMLVDRSGILSQENFYDCEDGQYSPDRALDLAYTYCIRRLQQKNIFGSNKE